MNNKIYILVLLIIVLFGAGLRMYHLGEQSLWNDEAYSYNSGLDILDNGWKDTPSGGELSLSIINSGLLAVSFWVFGDSEWSARFPSAIFGVLTIVVVFFLANIITKNRSVALLSSAMIAFLSIEIAWSRQARMYQELQFFYVLSLYFLLLYIDRKNSWYLLVFAIFVLLTVLTHRLGLLLVLVGIVYLALNIKEKRSFYDIRFVGIVVFVVSSLVVLQICWSIPSSVIGEIGYCNWLPYYASYFRVVFPIITLFAVVGSVVLLRKDSNMYVLLILPIFVPLAVLCYGLDRGVGYRFVYMVLPFVFILATYAVVWSCDIIKGLHFSSRSILSIRALLLILLVSVLFFGSGSCIIPKREYYGFDPSIQQPKFKEAYAYVNSNIIDGDVVIDSWPSVGIHYLDRLPNYRILSYGLTRYRDVIMYVDSYDTLKDIVCTESGWFIVDTVGMELLCGDSRFFDVDIKGFIDGSMNIDCVIYGKKGDITVYSW